MAERPQDFQEMAELPPEKWQEMLRRLDAQKSGAAGQHVAPAEARPAGTGTPTGVPGTTLTDSRGTLENLSNNMTPEMQAAQDDIATIMGPATKPGEVAKTVGTEVLDAIKRQQDPAKMRQLLRGSGAAAGGLGGFASPMPGGTMIGTGLGSMAGNYMADLYESYYNASRGNPGEKPELLTSSLSHVKDAALDAAVTGGTQIVYSAVAGAGKALLSKLLRLPPNSKELLREAADIGVDLGAANLPGSRAAGAVKVLGQVPLIGGGAQAAARTQARQLVAAQNDMFGKVANPKNMNEVSQEAFEAGMQKFNDFATGIQRQFEHAARLGEEAGGVIPSDSIKKAAETMLTKATSLPGGMKNYFTNKEIQFLQSLDKLPSNISTLDVKAIEGTLENVVRRTMNKTNIMHPEIGKMHETVLKSLGASDHPAAKAMARVDNEFREGVKKFATEEAGTIGELRNIYAIGKVAPGTKTADEVVETISKLNTPAAVENMRAVVGDDAIRQVARLKLDTAWEKAVTSAEGQPFKWSGEKFKAALGLDDPASKAYATTEAMLRGSGVTTAELTKLASVADRVAAAPVADVSTFMARAAALRGAGGIHSALKGALTVGLAKKGADKAGIISTITGLALARQGVGSLMRPGLVKAATASMDESLGTAARIAALGHFFDLYPTEDLEDLVDSYVTPEMQKGIQDAFTRQ